MPAYPPPDPHCGININEPTTQNEQRSSTQMRRDGPTVSYSNVHMERESWHNGTAHKLKLDEGAENSQRANGAACMARNGETQLKITANLELV
jgi:flagellar basal body L-ring protein FlgH